MVVGTRRLTAKGNEEEEGQSSRCSGRFTTDWTTDKSWFDSRQRQQTFLLRFQIGSRSHSASLARVSGSFSPGLKASGLRMCPSSSAKFQTLWSYTYTPSHVFIAWCLINLSLEWRHEDSLLRKVLQE